MDIEPRFLAHSYDLCLALIIELRYYRKLAGYQEPEWKIHSGSVRNRLGTTGIDLMRWIVSEIKKQNLNLGLT